MIQKVADIPDVDLSKIGTTKFGSFEVEVVDYTAEYFATLKARGWGASRSTEVMSFALPRGSAGMMCPGLVPSPRPLAKSLAAKGCPTCACPYASPPAGGV